MTLQMKLNNKKLFNSFCSTFRTSESLLGKDKETLTIQYAVIDRFEAGRIISILGDSVIKWELI